MRFYRLAIGILAVWRVTHLLNAEDGPGDLVVRLRRRAGSGFWAEALDCFYCLSVWVAAAWAMILGEDAKDKFTLAPALSGGAILLERLTSRAAAPLAQYHEDEEVGDAMLRQ